MKTIGIIAEYNPFHSGHAYQIRQARVRFGADYVVVVMSGDFVQRGEPAIFDKYLRTEIALSSGADLVLELPVCFATSSAEDFATAGVTLLDKLRIVDGICFGSELGDIRPLNAAAQILAEEPEIYRQSLQNALRTGDSFPKARSKALFAVLSTCSEISCSDSLKNYENSSASMIADILSSPNNILGIEYLKALRRRNSKIEPLTIQRQGQGYHDTFLKKSSISDNSFTHSSEHCYPSASALRHGIADGSLDYFQYLSREIPDTYSRTPIFADGLSLILNWKLQELLADGQDLTRYSDISSELAGRLANTALQFETFTGRIGQLKTKQYTYTRISRALLHLVLGITNEDIAKAKALDYCPYIRILGFRRSSASLLSAIKRNCTLPLITKTADAEQVLEGDALKLFRKDLLASHLRQTLDFQKCGILQANEYTRSVIVNF